MSRGVEMLTNGYCICVSFLVQEYTFYTMTVEHPDGSVTVSPFAGRPGHTVMLSFQKSSGLYFG